MKKVVNPCLVIGQSRMSNQQITYRVFCKIEYENERLSISGVIGPYKNGDAWGSCGQIDDTIRGHMKNKELTYTKGWGSRKLTKFLDVWGKWHLNDMRPRCQHQVGPEWENKELTITHYELPYKTWYEIEQVLKNDTDDLFNIKNTVDLEQIIKDTNSKEAHLLYEAHKSGILGYKGSTTPITKEYPYLFRAIEEGVIQLKVTEERKWASWVYPSEHPNGFLTKPCPECGYKYGTQWLFEAVPNDVIKFLQNFPETEVQPAWV